MITSAPSRYTIASSKSASTGFVHVQYIQSSDLSVELNPVMLAGANISIKLQTEGSPAQFHPPSIVHVALHPSNGAVLLSSQASSAITIIPSPHCEVQSVDAVEPAAGSTGREVFPGGSGGSEGTGRDGG